jgi:hypothetical protein
MYIQSAVMRRENLIIGHVRVTIHTARPLTTADPRKLSDLKQTTQQVSIAATAPTNRRRNSAHDPTKIVKADRRLLALQARTSVQ